MKLLQSKKADDIFNIYFRKLQEQIKGQNIHMYIFLKNHTQPGCVTIRLSYLLDYTNLTRLTDLAYCLFCMSYTSTEAVPSDSEWILLSLQHSFHHR